MMEVKPVALKRCSKCYYLKSLSDFYKKKKSKDGLQDVCKSCSKESMISYFKTDKGKSLMSRYNHKRRDAGYFTYGNGAISRLKQSSESRGHKFNLTPEQLEDWWKSTPDNCYYCGITTEVFIILKNKVLESDESNYHIHKFKPVFRKTYKKIIELTIDRVDNAIGYELGNMVKCCWFCNFIKGTLLSSDDMKLIARGIIFRLQIEIGYPKYIAEVDDNERRRSTSKDSR